MIRKIKSKLGVKIFIITFLLLSTCSFITYLFIAWFMPKVYTSDIKEVEGIALEISQELPVYTEISVSDFLKSIELWFYKNFEGAFSIHLFQENGVEFNYSDLTVKENKRVGDYANIPKTSTYEIILSDSKEQYSFFITNNSIMANQALIALYKTLPALILMVVLLSILSALIYSWYITAPIIRISKVSRHMAELSFDLKCDGKRSDEIGVLSNNLNELTLKLSTALTELHNANNKLQEDIEKERLLKEQRLEFFSAVSHELKTPITIIKGQLQGMLYNVGRYKDRETYLTQCIDVTQTLEKMVQELLTITRLETPGYTYKRIDLDVSSLLNERLNFQEDLVLQKGLFLEKSITPGIYIKGDLQLLQKVFDNLITNAIKYSPLGNFIRVKLLKEGQLIVFMIQNTGIHLDESELPKLYEPFYRVEQSRNRHTGGNGLGLHIVKTILNLHAAEYKIVSDEDSVVFQIQF